MTTHPITRPTDAFGRRVEFAREFARLRARVAPPPDPNAWITLLCHRCERPFKFRGVARHCVSCIAGAASLGVVGSEWIGEVSGG